MATSDYSNLTGIILREFAYKETSKILEVFTKDYGRISIIAKGVLGKKSSNAALSQRFVKASFDLYKSGKDFFGLREVSLINAYSKSNKNFDIILYKSAIADLLLRTIDNIQIDMVYRLLDNSFSAFEEADKNQVNIFLAFLIKYISFSGFKPNLATCASCGKKITNEDIYFSISQASIVCNDDKYQVHDKIFLTKEEFVYLKKLLYTDSSKLADLKLLGSYQKIGALIIDYTLEKLELSRFPSMDWVYQQKLERN